MALSGSAAVGGRGHTQCSNMLPPGCFAVMSSARRFWGGRGGWEGGGGDSEVQRPRLERGGAHGRSTLPNPVNHPAAPTYSASQSI